MEMNDLTYVFVAIMIVLIVFQTLQIDSINKQIAEGKLAVAKVQTTNAVQPASGSSSAPSSLNDLPSMVGGC